MERQQWYQVTYTVKNKIYKGWIPMLCAQQQQDTMSMTTPTRQMSRNNTGMTRSESKTFTGKSPRKSILKNSRSKLTETNSPSRHGPQKSLVILDLKENRVTPILKRKYESQNHTELVKVAHKSAVQAKVGLTCGIIVNFRSSHSLKTITAKNGC